MKNKVREVTKGSRNLWGVCLSKIPRTKPVVAPSTSSRAGPLNVQQPKE